MKKRTLIFRNEDPARGQGHSLGESRVHDYSTASFGWTLTGWTLDDAQQKTYYVEKAGGDGSWDLSTVLTDGLPRYNNRNLTATLELSDGTREERQRQISRMVNLLDGWEWEIFLPDHPAHFLKGRVRVTVDQNSLAFAKATVTAICEPWFYSTQERVVKLTPSTTEWKWANLWNEGRRRLNPTITVVGDVSLATFKDYDTQELEQITLQSGTYSWPALFIPPGGSMVAYMGAGALTITYREAVLR